MTRTDTKTLIAALRTLSRHIQTDDGVANAAINEAADRLEELHEQATPLPDDCRGSIIPCQCGSPVASVSGVFHFPDSTRFQVSCAGCGDRGPRGVLECIAIARWNDYQRTMRENDILDIGIAFRIASRDQDSRGKADRVMDLMRLYDRVKKLLISEDGDGSHVHRPL